MSHDIFNLDGVAFAAGVHCGSMFVVGIAQIEKSKVGQINRYEFRVMKAGSSDVLAIAEHSDIHLAGRGGVRWETIASGASAILP